ncbi:MAG: hypothetical protein ACERKD_04305 [Prolixibacteraceae bacterium]
MDYSELKSELHRLIDEVNDEDALYTVQSILEGLAKPDHDWADDLSDEMRTALEKSIEDADAGRVISHNEAMKIIHQKYDK